MRVSAVAGAALAAVLLGPAGGVRAGCVDTDSACEISSGSYHVELPSTAVAAPGLPALIFLHGWGGSGQGTLSNRGMVEAVLARGYAVIAPDGLPRAQGNGRSWSFHPDRPAGRDETAFLIAVADDAAARFGVDRGRMLLGGFSIGGSMASYVACAAPDAFAAFAPVAGSFWRPLPGRCAGPVRLLHTHGWTDATVPLEGRRVGSAGATQGDVFAAQEIWRQANGCDRIRPDNFGEAGAFWWRRWTDCKQGSALEFALHPGAHDIPRGWSTLVLDWFEGL